MKLTNMFLSIRLITAGVGGYYATSMTTGTQVEGHASWSYVSDSFEGLIESENSDLIAIATVKDKGKDSYFPLAEDETYVFTDATLEIDEVLFSEEGIVADDEIIVTQYGGKLKDGNVLEYHDVPLFTKNKKQVLVFLQKVVEDSERNGKYQYVGGNLGLYYVDDNKVKTIVDHKIAKEIKDKDIKEVKGKIKDKVKAFYLPTNPKEQLK